MCERSTTSRKTAVGAYASILPRDRAVPAQDGGGRSIASADASATAVAAAAAAMS
jgi:hypothetical protein